MRQASGDTRLSNLFYVSRLIGSIAAGYAFTVGYISFFGIIFTHFGLAPVEAVSLSAMTGLLAHVAIMIWIVATSNLPRTLIMTASSSVVMMIGSMMLM